jgi:hypothetical protein
MCKITTVLRRIETLALSLRGKSEFGVLENKMLRGIFGLKREGYREGRKMDVKDHNKFNIRTIF